MRVQREVRTLSSELPKRRKLSSSEVSVVGVNGLEPPTSSLERKERKTKGPRGALGAGLTRDAEKVELIRPRNLGPTNNSQQYWWALRDLNPRLLPCKGMQGPLPYQGKCPKPQQLQAFDSPRMRGIGDHFAPLRGPNADQICRPNGCRGDPLRHVSRERRCRRLNPRPRCAFSIGAI
jgi:hypothetical protein